MKQQILEKQVGAMEDTISQLRGEIHALQRALEEARAAYSDLAAQRAVEENGQ